jgi:chromosomal replication initiation ATPase DnaA
MPLMDFVRNITTSLRHNTIENIKSYYQSADLLLVDDILKVGLSLEKILFLSAPLKT